MFTPVLVLLRHGESQWNLENRFTGWTDIPLTPKGITEAHQAGHLLREQAFCFDFVFTSVLSRAAQTLWIVLEELDLVHIPVEQTWRLNERHYGALQGLDKSETARVYGQEIVHRWRRSYAVRPPALDLSDVRHPRFDSRYAKIPPNDLPATESLEDTLIRILPLWSEEILPVLAKGSNVLVVAHGNSLRALVKHLERIPEADVPKLYIDTGVPYIYRLEVDSTGEKVFQRIGSEQHS